MNLILILKRGLLGRELMTCLVKYKAPFSKQATLTTNLLVTSRWSRPRQWLTPINLNRS